MHWSFEPHEVQALLPSGLVVDEYQDRAWVSFTPFVMSEVRPFGPVRLPGPLPAILTFPETNLRTYVRGPDPSDGLWFLSNEVSSALMAMAARSLAGLPTIWAI